MDILTDVAVIVAGLLFGGLLIWPRVAGSTLWRATVTPLASIIGSGFLVLGPILINAYGSYAPAMMAGLCIVGWAFGAAIRSNIARIDRAGADRAPDIVAVDRAGAMVLAFAYVVSVAYYLNLFGAFAVSLTPWDTDLAARCVTTTCYVVILVAGGVWGFRALEWMEQSSVTLKLAIIAGLLAGLVVYFARQAEAGALVWTPPPMDGWTAVRLAFGLIVTVQGFETSRYLGANYDAATRIRSMRLAQIIATLIYVVYIVLLTFVFAPDAVDRSETAIIDMMGQVATILPGLLLAAALAAQFSAAVADTNGCEGLTTELSRGRLTGSTAHLVLAAIGLALTWSMDVFAIIAWASRAFAFYYAIQSAMAAMGAAKAGRRLAAAGWGALALFGLAITLMGLAVEG